MSASDPGTPDRDGIVELLVSIGVEAVERCEADYVKADFAGAATFLRVHAEAFVGLARDDDCLVRQAPLSRASGFPRRCRPGPRPVA